MDNESTTVQSASRQGGKRLVVLLGDSPGYYTHLMYEIANLHRQRGGSVVTLATCPYYEKYYGFDFTDHGEVHYLSHFLEGDLSAQDISGVEIDYWAVYPTFVRSIYFSGAHKNDWATYHYTALFLRQFYADQSPDLVISEVASNSFLYLNLLEAHKQGISHLGFISARLPNKINVHLDAFGRKLMVNRQRSDDARSEIEGVPDYMMPNNRTLIDSNVLTKIFRFIRYSGLRSIETRSTAMHQLSAIWNQRVVKKLRHLQLKVFGGDVFSSDLSSDDTINILFPLHFRPEASTTVLSRYYENDLELLKNIAFSLPHNARLIVKEHKSAPGVRNLAFFRQLLALPNIELLSPDFNLGDNLTRFDAVVALSGTVGFEAAQLGIPVYLLGQTFYSDYENVIQVESYRALEECLRTTQKNPNPKPSPEVMSGYREACFPGRFDYMNKAVMTKENVENISQVVEQALAQLGTPLKGH